MILYCYLLPSNLFSIGYYHCLLLFSFVTLPHTWDTLYFFSFVTFYFPYYLVRFLFLLSLWLYPFYVFFWLLIVVVMSCCCSFFLVFTIPCLSFFMPPKKPIASSYRGPTTSKSARVIDPKPEKYFPPLPFFLFLTDCPLQTNSGLGNENT